MSGSDRIACGTPIDDLLEQVAAHGRPQDPAHQASCPHCRAALAEITELWRPVDRLAGVRAAAPPDLLAAVTEAVRRLPRHGWHAVLPTDRGETRIAGRVIAAVVRRAAAQTDHVTLAVGRARSGRDAAHVGVAGTHVVIDVQVAVELGSAVPVLADQLRRHIREHLRAHTGLSATEINIAVLDVTPRGVGAW
ncbi:Asp23/Gls24 family envelope stress response protein [Xylanimonas sp. McL0601]|uniref:Asp23/Gls24 family envelope stress response protein n=1 Tax=Xylanimonas sp. McL0601 TaxID=3414739 RepID=UPI003CEBFCAF